VRNAHVAAAAKTGVTDDDTGTPGDGDVATGRPCPLCGVGMARRHCKYVCPNHGVVYDCSDTFW
jgi:predicted RNA-binding Zn-ribbon protein involved in translation (DUF1610 family)